MSSTEGEVTIEQTSSMAAHLTRMADHAVAAAGASKAAGAATTEVGEGDTGSVSSMPSAAVTQLHTSKGPYIMPSTPKDGHQRSPFAPPPAGGHQRAATLTAASEASTAAMLAAPTTTQQAASSSGMNHPLLSERSQRRLEAAAALREAGALVEAYSSVHSEDTVQLQVQSLLGNTMHTAAAAAATTVPPAVAAASMLPRRQPDDDGAPAASIIHTYLQSSLKDPKVRNHNTWRYRAHRNAMQLLMRELPAAADVLEGINAEYEHWFQCIRRRNGPRGRRLRRQRFRRSAKGRVARAIRRMRRARTRGSQGRGQRQGVSGSKSGKGHRQDKRKTTAAAKQGAVPAQQQPAGDGPGSTKNIWATLQAGVARPPSQPHSPWASNSVRQRRLRDGSSSSSRSRSRSRSGSSRAGKPGTTSNNVWEKASVASSTISDPLAPARHEVPAPSSLLPNRRKTSPVKASQAQRAAAALRTMVSPRLLPTQSQYPQQGTPEGAPQGEPWQDNDDDNDDVEHVFPYDDEEGIGAGAGGHGAHGTGFHERGLMAWAHSELRRASRAATLEEHGGGRQQQHHHHRTSAASRRRTGRHSRQTPAQSDTPSSSDAWCPPVSTNAALKALLPSYIRILRGVSAELGNACGAEGAWLGDVLDRCGKGIQSGIYTLDVQRRQQQQRHAEELQAAFSLLQRVTRASMQEAVPSRPLGAPSPVPGLRSVGLVLDAPPSRPQTAASRRPTASSSRARSRGRSISSRAGSRPPSRPPTAYTEVGGADGSATARYKRDMHQQLRLEFRARGEAVDEHKRVKAALLNLRSVGRAVGVLNADTGAYLPVPVSVPVPSPTPSTSASPVARRGGGDARAIDAAAATAAAESTMVEFDYLRIDHGYGGTSDVDAGATGDRGTGGAVGMETAAGVGDDDDGPDDDDGGAATAAAATTARAPMSTVTLELKGQPGRDGPLLGIDGSNGMPVASLRGAKVGKVQESRRAASTDAVRAGADGGGRMELELELEAELGGPGPASSPQPAVADDDRLSGSGGGRRGQRRVTAGSAQRVFGRSLRPRVMDGDDIELSVHRSSTMRRHSALTASPLPRGVRRLSTGAAASPTSPKLWQPRAVVRNGAVTALDSWNQDLTLTPASIMFSSRVTQSAAAGAALGQLATSPSGDRHHASIHIEQPAGEGEADSVAGSHRGGSGGGSGGGGGGGVDIGVDIGAVASMSSLMSQAQDSVGAVGGELRGTSPWQGGMEM